MDSGFHLISHKDALQMWFLRYANSYLIAKCWEGLSSGFLDQVQNSVVVSSVLLRIPLIPVSTKLKVDHLDVFRTFSMLAPRQPVVTPWVRVAAPNESRGSPPAACASWSRHPESKSIWQNVNENQKLHKSYRICSLSGHNSHMSCHKIHKSTWRHRVGKTAVFSQ